MASHEITSELTICSVYYSEHSKKCLELNVELTKKANPKYNWTWIVGDNTLGESKIKPQGKRLLIVPGTEVPDSMPLGVRGSYHHAAALNKLLCYIKTRFVLFLDYDFYIIRPEWMKDVISHMMDNSLSFLGAPWHPKWHIKYRYFPCVHCLFVDLDKVSIQSIDFTPKFDKGITRLEELKHWIPKNLSLVLRSLAKVFRALTLRDRKSIGSSRDTGYALFRQYGQDSQVRCESVVPVFRSSSDFRGPAYATLRLNRLIEKLLPDRLCFIPKKPGYYTETGFRELGYFDTGSRQWEEFIWQGLPFGFHIRGYQQDKRDETELIAIKQAIENLSKQQ